MDTFYKLIDCCIDHLVENRAEIGRFDLERRDLLKTKGGFNPLRWRTQELRARDGRVSLEVVPGPGPMLYPKLIYSPKTDKISSLFLDSVTDEVVDPTKPSL